MIERRVPVHGVCLVLATLAATFAGGASCGSPFVEAPSDAGGKDSASDITVPIGDDSAAETGPSGEGGQADGPTAEGGSGEGSATDGGSAEGASGGDASDGGTEGASDAGGDALADGPSGTEGGGQEGGAPEGGTEGGVVTCGSGQSCVPAPPGGWSGPIQFYYAAGTAPACPGTSTPAFAGGTGLNGAPATCSTCSCGSATITCGASFDFYEGSTSGCATPCGSQVVTTCAPVATGCTQAGIGFSVNAVVAGGSCTPSAQNPSVPPTSWTTNAKACLNGASTSCTGGVCTESAASNYAICIYQAADVPCPSTGYTTKQLVYSSVTDGRTCTPCGCGTPGGTCSGGSVSLADEGTCTTETFARNMPTGCANPPVSATGLFAEVKVAPTLADAGTCPPDGGAPTGSAAPASPMTVCCGP